MEVTKLRVLHMEEPLGIDRNPYFSWKLESQQNDTVQSTYHITVREQDSDKIVWDTGVQHGRANAFIPYGGAPLPRPAIVGRCGWRTIMAACPMPRLILRPLF